MDTTPFSALIPEASRETREEIGQTLKLFGESALNFSAAAGVTIRALRTGELFRSASPALRRLGIDVDLWPTPPAGLFVVEERRVYLRSLSAMTVAHEFGHAFDCALGGGVYLSGINTGIRQAFASAKSFITPYAATGLDEYFAEGVRAYVGANHPASSWPLVSRARLRRIDATMFEIIDGLFQNLGAEGQPKKRI